MQTMHKKKEEQQITQRFKNIGWNVKHSKWFFWWLTIYKKNTQQLESSTRNDVNNRRNTFQHTEPHRSLGGVEIDFCDHVITQCVIVHNMYYIYTINSIWNSIRRWGDHPDIYPDCNGIILWIVFSEYYTSHDESYMMNHDYITFWFIGFSSY